MQLEREPFRSSSRIAAVARERGIDEGFVLTEPDDAAADALSAKAGGVRSEVVMWDLAFGAR